MIRKTMILCAVFSFLVACKQDKKVVKEKAEKTIEKIAKTNPSESLGAKEIKWMFDNIDQIDYEFNDIPISMALSESSAIKNNVGYISPNVQWEIPANCKPIGKQLFYSKGELSYEADLYFDDKCRFLVFYKDGKPTYRNKMTSHGQNFYKNVFAQVQGVKKQ